MTNHWQFVETVIEMAFDYRICYVVNPLHAGPKRVITRIDLLISKDCLFVQSAEY